MRCSEPLDIAIHPFVRRQTPNSPFTHWTCSDEELLRRVRENWFQGKPGYRDGVMLVPINPEGVMSSVVVLKAGDPLKGAYLPRQEGEEPRKVMGYDTGEVGPEPFKFGAVRADVVLYHRDVLAEDGDAFDHEWGIITVLGNPTEEESPMDPETLMSNHFHVSGGTQTHMTDGQFVEALKKSFFYWRDKALVR